MPGQRHAGAKGARLGHALNNDRRHFKISAICLPRQGPVNGSNKTKITNLSPTGSIDVTTLNGIASHPDKCEVWALAAGSNVDVLAEQIKKFNPQVVSLFDTSKIPELLEKLNGHKVELVAGEAGSVQVATLPEVDLVVSGMVGCAGLVPTYAAVQAGKTVAPANKEALVVAGAWMLGARTREAQILPLDSEPTATLPAPSAATFSPWLGTSSAMDMREPSAAKPWTMARPMLDPPPVTMTCLPFRPNSMGISL